MKIQNKKLTSSLILIESLIQPIINPYPNSIWFLKTVVIFV